MSSPLFPAEATIETSLRCAYSTARLTAVMTCAARVVLAERGRPSAERAVHEKLELATSTPCSAAQTKEQMTASARKMSLAPFRTAALITASLTFGAMPTMPWPFAAAA